VKKIKYTCKLCGWQTSIHEEWEDLKPQRCMNRKCNTSFRVNPENLIITKPEAEAVQENSEKREKRHGKHRKD